MIIEESKILKSKLKDILSNENFENEFEVIEVNNDRPFTFNSKDYEVKEGKPIYTDSNKYGKSGTATAIISKNTIAIYTSEHITYPEPINWEKLEPQRKRLSNGKETTIYEKCHIIGYHLSARFSSPHNIFIGTYTLNHGAMRNIEDTIYDKVNDEDRVFLYKVTPIYMFKNDIVPIGILFEYETIDKKEKITHCQFCFNGEKGKKINYYDGSNIKFEDTNKRIDDTTKFVEDKSKTSKETNRYRNYYIDVRTKIFHLVFDDREKCIELKNVKGKYIQETTGDPEEISQKGYEICKKCSKTTDKMKKESKWI